jgi:hypothetical protein
MLTTLDLSPSKSAQIASPPSELIILLYYASLLPAYVYLVSS